jgi:hypothetical protein
MAGTCSGGLIAQRDDTIAGCTNDADVDGGGCAGPFEPTTTWADSLAAIVGHHADPEACASCLTSRANLNGRVKRLSSCTPAGDARAAVGMDARRAAGFEHP